MTDSDNNKSMATQLAPLREAIMHGQDDFQRFFKAREKTTPSHSDIVRAYLDQRGIVFGVFKDPEHELGWNTVIIKGHDALTAILASGMAQPKSVGAIPCACVEEAVALSQVLGDAPHG